MRPDGLDMINLKTATAAAGFAAITITLKDLCPQGFPALCPRDLLGIAVVFFADAHGLLPSSGELACSLSEVIAVISRKPRRSGISLMPSIP